MKQALIRLAEPRDTPDLLDIYIPFITDSHTSFEYEVPTLANFQARIDKVLTLLPFLVLEKEGTIAGYAYASPHRSRTAYQWSVETSIYMNAAFRGQGLGRILYQSLFACLRYQGFFNAYAGISLPNPASEAFHRSFGFELIGIYKHVGFKNGRWYDTSWSQLSLQKEGTEPREPLWLPEVDQDDAGWRACLNLS
jgi:L-amino acid N-acyltransferase YncA